MSSMLALSNGMTNFHTYFMSGPVCHGLEELKTRRTGRLTVSHNPTLSLPLKADSHIACRTHAVPFG